MMNVLVGVGVDFGRLWAGTVTKRVAPEKEYR